MYSYEDDFDIVTYSIIDSYAKKHFPKGYASLPDPSTIKIDFISDEQFRPTT